MKRILLIIIMAVIVTTIGVVRCNRPINHTDGEAVRFVDLPKVVQDSLMGYGERSLMSDNDIISINSDYSLVFSTFGPWITSTRLKRNSDGKEWKFSSHLNIPKPMVTVGDTLYIPSDYNLVDFLDVEPDVIFYRQILK